MAMKHVLGYMKHTQNYAMHYNKYQVVIEGHSDANWLTGSNEVKSISDYVLHLVEELSLGYVQIVMFRLLHNGLNLLL